MTNIIQSLADWLTSPHTIELIGWQWIIFTPIVLIVFGIIVFALTFFNIGKIILPW